jgi:hypothetical protein
VRACPNAVHPSMCAPIVPVWNNAHPTAPCCCFVQELAAFLVGQEPHIIFDGHCLGFTVSADSTLLAANVRRFTNPQQVREDPSLEASLEKRFTLEVYRLPSLEKIAGLSGHLDNSPEGAEPYLVWPHFSPDGRYLLSGCGLGRSLEFTR